MNYLHVCSNCVEGKLGPLYFDFTNKDEYDFGETNLYLDLPGLGVWRLTLGSDFFFGRIPA